MVASLTKGGEGVSALPGVPRALGEALQLLKALAQDGAALPERIQGLCALAEPPAEVGGGTVADLVRKASQAEASARRADVLGEACAPGQAGERRGASFSRDLPLGRTSTPGKAGASLEGAVRADRVVEGRALVESPGQAEGQGPGRQADRLEGSAPEKGLKCLPNVDSGRPTALTRPGPSPLATAPRSVPPGETAQGRVGVTTWVGEAEVVSARLQRATGSTDAALHPARNLPDGGALLKTQAVRTPDVAMPLAYEAPPHLAPRPQAAPRLLQPLVHSHQEGPAAPRLDSDIEGREQQVAQRPKADGVDFRSHEVRAHVDSVSGLSDEVTRSIRPFHHRAAAGLGYEYVPPDGRARQEAPQGSDDPIFVVRGLGLLSDHLHAVQQYHSQAREQLQTPFLFVPFWFGEGMGWGQWTWWREDGEAGGGARDGSCGHMVFDLKLQGLGRIKIAATLRERTLSLGLAGEKEAIPVLRAGLPALKVALGGLGYRMDVCSLMLIEDMDPSLSLGPLGPLSEGGGVVHVIT